MYTYDVVAESNGKEIKRQTGLRNYAAAAMLNNMWITEGIHIIENGKIKKLTPDAFTVSIYEIITRKR